MSNRKLTWNQVDMIRVRHICGEKQADLANEFGITYGSMGSILRYESWTVKPEPGICSQCRLEVKTRRGVCAQCRIDAKEAGYARGVLETAIRFRAQGKCEACGTEDRPERQSQHHLDHNHGTGVLRGEICMKCNLTLGAAGDNPEILEALAKYLRDRGFSATRFIEPRSIDSTPTTQSTD